MQIEIGKEMIFDKLCAAAKARTVWRVKFWMTDESISTYVRSAGLIGVARHGTGRLGVRYGQLVTAQVGIP